MKNFVALTTHKSQFRNVLKPEAFLSSSSSKREMLLDGAFTPFNGEKHHHFWNQLLLITQLLYCIK